MPPQVTQQRLEPPLARGVRETEVVSDRERRVVPRGAHGDAARRAKANGNPRAHLEHLAAQTEAGHLLIGELRALTRERGQRVPQA